MFSLIIFLFVVTIFKKCQVGHSIFLVSI